MSEVTVRAMQPVLGLADGAVVTVERTRRVDAAITGGALQVVSEAEPPPPTPAVAPPEAPAPADEPPQKRARPKASGTRSRDESA